LDSRRKIGVLKEPPDIVSGGGYAILVPAVDGDGNDRAGVRGADGGRTARHYCGWNLRARGFGHGAMYELSGTYIPLPGVAEERRTTGDPSRSILERYPNAEAYVDAITAAARLLVEAGLMLEEDVERAAE
jgi:Alpha/beta hydrolase domain